MTSEPARVTAEDVEGYFRNWLHEVDCHALHNTVWTHPSLRALCERCTCGRDVAYEAMQRLAAQAQRDAEAVARLTDQHQEALEWIGRTLRHDARRCGDVCDPYESVEAHNAESTWLNETAERLLHGWRWPSRSSTETRPDRTAAMAGLKTLVKELSQQLEAAEQRVRALEAALRKYADPANYDGTPSATDMDDGEVARAALAPPKRKGKA